MGVGRAAALQRIPCKRKRSQAARAIGRRGVRARPQVTNLGGHQGVQGESANLLEFSLAKARMVNCKVLHRLDE